MMAFTHMPYVSNDLSNQPKEASVPALLDLILLPAMFNYCLFQKQTKKQQHTHSKQNQEGFLLVQITFLQSLLPQSAILPQCQRGMILADSDKDIALKRQLKQLLTSCANILSLTL